MAREGVKGPDLDLIQVFKLGTKVLSDIENFYQMQI